ncbi:uncharacterized protein N7459_008592 [Penicillium hispanicum]|uniref:uncharacterized protein n=1 Tax=Penicillium hispanicum TaxID=1080232 RepID=UPI00253F9CFE|nr:uncharacterized protein N7459_008592 [Penicillium hispanicum]KAJ5574165.1 hypothetical protein N7459_008592 [Penicillium hispanicum]
MMATHSPRYFSPKRKREPSGSDYYSPPVSPTSTVSIASLQETRLREDAELGRYSPRAAVAGRFGELAIRNERLPDPGLLATQRQQISAPHQAQENRAAESRHDAQNVPGAWPVHSGEPDEAQDHQSSPRTQRQKNTNFGATAPSASPSKRKSATSPRKQPDPSSPSKSRKQRLSPPLADTSLEDPFTWHDHEITGHNPTDPSDDGYGINGVGFRPTAATAWARSQKRQKQVAEWKNREAREAREKRRERRNEGIKLDRLRSIHNGAIQKRVKFDV